MGKTYVVTKAHANVLEELGGEDAYDALKQLFSESSEADRALLQRGVHVGVAIDEHLSDFRPGDFLVHNLMGVYQESKLMINSLRLACSRGYGFLFRWDGLDASESNKIKYLVHRIAKCTDL